MDIFDYVDDLINDHLVVPDSYLIKAHKDCELTVTLIREGKHVDLTCDGLTHVKLKEGETLQVEK